MDTNLDIDLFSKIKKPHCHLGMKIRKLKAKEKMVIERAINMFRTIRWLRKLNRGTKKIGTQIFSPLKYWCQSMKTKQLNQLRIVLK